MRPCFAEPVLTAEALSPAVAAFWDKFLRARPEVDPRRLYEAFRFGNTQAMADQLAQLVVERRKTATSSLLWSYEAQGKRPVQPGDLCIPLNWAGQPMCVIETLEVRIVPFSEIDARFAWDYGEGDRSLAWWRKHLWDYYRDVECPAVGKHPSEDMPLVCERFSVVFGELH